MVRAYARPGGNQEGNAVQHRKSDSFGGVVGVGGAKACSCMGTAAAAAVIAASAQSNQEVE